MSAQACSCLGWAAVLAALHASRSGNPHGVRAMGYVVGGRVRSPAGAPAAGHPERPERRSCSISARSAGPGPRLATADARAAHRARRVRKHPVPGAHPGQWPTGRLARPCHGPLPRTMTTLARWTPCSKPAVSAHNDAFDMLQIAHVYRDLGFAEDAYAWAARAYASWQRPPEDAVIQSTRRAPSPSWTTIAPARWPPRPKPRCARAPSAKPRRSFSRR